jgi:excisionase family DNA binding protein
MNKITAEHISRVAIVYIRQSTSQQVENNLESRRRQYRLEQRAKEMGWNEVIVIDEDQGRSGSGSVIRTGFEWILDCVCQGRAGAIFSTEASRLARNGREWHSMLEFCAVVNTLIIDEDGIYDPKSTNDRLLLGMKGTLSEMELTTFRQRSQKALRMKAERGELYTVVSVGYVRRPGDDGIEKDPDRRIQSAIALVFRKFRELGSARQVWLWLCQEGIELPSIDNSFPEKKPVWVLPVYSAVLRILTNPVYGGAYVYGRTETQTRIVEGRKKVRKGRPRKQEDWEVLIEDHHEGYISWEEYQSIQSQLKENANIKGSLVRGSIRDGEALLSGLLRCGHCGRKLQVHYSGNNSRAVRYRCRNLLTSSGPVECISFGAYRVEEAVEQELLRVLTPLGLEAALGALENNRKQSEEKLLQREMALQQAGYEATLARRQYDAVDPENRLVASELEARWNVCLQRVQELEEEVTQLKSEQGEGLLGQERERLLELGRNIPAVWNHRSAPTALKKRILRTVVNEIVVSLREERIRLVLHWQGGDHTEREVVRNRSGEHRWQTDVETERIIRELSRMMPDGALAGLLNRLGKRTARGHTWTQARVCSFRKDRKIPVYQEGERRARGELTLDEAAKELRVGKSSVHRLIRKKILPASQVCRGAPWVIRKSDLALQTVKEALRHGIPLAVNEKQVTIEFQ